MLYYAEEQILVRRYEDLCTLLAMEREDPEHIDPKFRNRFSSDPKRELLMLQRWLLDDLVKKLRRGELIAKFFRPGEVVVVEVSPEWWLKPAIDLAANAATARRTRIDGVIIFRGYLLPTNGDKNAALNAAKGRKGERPVATGKLESWYGRRVKTWPRDNQGNYHDPPTPKRDLEAARAAFPNNLVSREAIRAARKAAAPPEWKLAGPRLRSRHN
jgi:hypothetical protein